MLELEFLPSVNKPNAKKAAELLAPVIVDLWEKKKPTETKSSCLKHGYHSECGDSVA